MVICKRCGEELKNIPGTDKFVSSEMGPYMQYCPDQRQLAAYGSNFAKKHIPKEKRNHMKNGPELTEEDQIEIGQNDGTGWPPPQEPSTEE